LAARIYADEDEKHPIEKVDARLRALMAWRKNAR